MQFARPEHTNLAAPLARSPFSMSADRAPVGAAVATFGCDDRSDGRQRQPFQVPTAGSHPAAVIDWLGTLGRDSLARGRNALPRTGRSGGTYENCHDKKGSRRGADHQDGILLLLSRPTGGVPEFYHSRRDPVHQAGSPSAAKLSPLTGGTIFKPEGATGEAASRCPLQMTRRSSRLLVTVRLCPAAAATPRSADRISAFSCGYKTPATPEEVVKRRPGV